MSYLSASKNALKWSCFLKAKMMMYFFPPVLSSIGQGKGFLKLLSYGPTQSFPSFYKAHSSSLLPSRILVYREKRALVGAADNLDQVSG